MRDQELIGLLLKRSDRLAGGSAGEHRREVLTSPSVLRGDRSQDLECARASAVPCRGVFDELPQEAIKASSRSSACDFDETVGGQLKNVWVQLEWAGNLLSIRLADRADDAQELLEAIPVQRNQPDKKRAPMAKR